MSLRMCPGCLATVTPCHECREARALAAKTDGLCICGADTIRITAYRVVHGRQEVRCVRCQGVVRKYSETHDLPKHKQTRYKRRLLPR